MKRRYFPLLFGIAATILISNPLKVYAHPENLNLTPEQKSQWEQIREQTKTQIQSILTPEQQQQFQTLDSQGQRRRGMMKELNLSDEQKTQMRKIMESSREQMANILTEEQREQFRQQRQARNKQQQ